MEMLDGGGMGGMDLDLGWHVVTCPPTVHSGVV